VFIIIDNVYCGGLPLIINFYKEYAIYGFLNAADLPAGMPDSEEGMVAGFVC